MFKIGEFSKLTQISIRMLRYYDAHGLLKPAYTDPESGYRFYTAVQVQELNRIIFLRDLGYTVAEIQLSLANWNAPYILEQLEKKKEETRIHILQEQEKLRTMDHAMDRLAQTDGMLQEDLGYNFTIRSIPSYPVISMRRKIANYFEEGVLWKELSSFVDTCTLDIDSGVCTFAIYHDLEYKESDVDVEVCVPLRRLPDPIPELPDSVQLHHTSAVDTMACTFVHGPFENIAGSYLAFAGWLSSHEHYQMEYPDRQICHKGPWNEEDPTQYLTEIQIPITQLTL